jgi:peptidoglycan/xylan/chitin deacetylase (PgdA/CDA1 family)
MHFYWTKTSRLIKKIFSDYVWELPNTENKVYLTFDDGPTPKITDWVLEQLEKYDAKATFFCIGNNIEKHPDIFDRIIKKGHSVGNHTYNHLNGWKTDNEVYLNNTFLCNGQILESDIKNQKSKIFNLFRPPYGKIRNKQATKLAQLGYKVIMWDVLSADFDNSISKERCLENVIKNSKSGSIIVFHDSAKAFPHLEYTLPKVLQYFKENSFLCDAIQQ